MINITEKEMNILIIALDFKPLYGGIAQDTHTIAKFLQSMGDKVIVLSQTMKGSESFDKNNSYQILRLEKSIYYKSKIINKYKIYKKIKEIVKKESIDIVILNTLGKSSFTFWFTSKLINLPLGIFVHGKDINLKFGNIEKFKKRFILRHSDLIICHSNFTKNIVKKLAVKSKKIYISAPAINTDMNKKTDNIPSKLKDIVKNKKVILTIGRLIERKGIDNAIKALKNVINFFPNIIYLIVGDGPFRKDLEQLTETLKLNDFVKFVGFITEDEKESYYNIADFFIMPARELENGDIEGFGIVFLEANCYELPVIGGNSGGITDAIEDGASGFLVNPLDINDITSAIIKLLKDDGLIKIMGKLGKIRVEKNFNEENIYKLREKLLTFI
jgi:phosphatidylinositol alpha-1,6-mannosyltransferase